MSAIVVLSMALTPVVVLLLGRILPGPARSMDGIEEPPCLSGRVLIIGFGRFGQVVSQPLLLRGVDVSIIDSDVDMIRAAGRFGFKVYYGDGTRLDVLRASGAARADAILVCSDKPEVVDRIVAVVKHEFPLARLYVRSFDRGHSLRLIAAGVDYQIRETFESAMSFGEQVLEGLGFEAGVVAETMADVRARDRERLELQVVGGITAGRSLMRGNLSTPEPEPLARPQHEARTLNEGAAAVIGGDEPPAH
jgi:glutathione-regulated potassium-efflux system protein KefB